MLNNKDWKHHNDLIFAQPSNLKFVRKLHSRHAIEVYTLRKHGHVMDVVVVAAALLGIILGLYFGTQ